MSHRLGKKLSAGAVPPVPPSGASAAPSRAAKEACFERDNGNNAMCSYRTVEGTTWVFPVKHFVAAHNADDGGTMQVITPGPRSSSEAPISTGSGRQSPAAMRSPSAL